MGLLYITKLQYGVMTKKYEGSVSYCPKLAIFGKIVRYSYVF
jgi:hypothetical protein